MTVVAFRAAKPRQLNIYALNDLMSQRGWHLSALQLPPALHMCFTGQHASIVDSLLKVHILFNPPAWPQWQLSQGDLTRLAAHAYFWPARQHDERLDWLPKPTLHTRRWIGYLHSLSSTAPAACQRKLLAACIDTSALLAGIDILAALRRHVLLIAGPAGVRGHSAEGQRRRQGRHGAHLWPSLGISRQEDYWGIPGGLPGCAPVRLSTRAPIQALPGNSRQGLTSRVCTIACSVLL